MIGRNNSNDGPRQTPQHFHYNSANSCSNPLPEHENNERFASDCVTSCATQWQKSSEQNHNSTNTLPIMEQILPQNTNTNFNPLQGSEDNYGSWIRSNELTGVNDTQHRFNDSSRLEPGSETSPRSSWGEFLFENLPRGSEDNYGSWIRSNELTGVNDTQHRFNDSSFSNSAYNYYHCPVCFFCSADWSQVQKHLHAVHGENSYLKTCQGHTRKTNSHIDGNVHLERAISGLRVLGNSKIQRDHQQCQQNQLMRHSFHRNTLIQNRK
nr:hypothetical transcript [Hymenolepis microstoma]